MGFRVVSQGRPQLDTGVHIRKHLSARVVDHAPVLVLVHRAAAGGLPPYGLPRLRNSRVVEKVISIRICGQDDILVCRAQPRHVKPAGRYRDKVVSKPMMDADRPASTSSSSSRCTPSPRNTPG